MELLIDVHYQLHRTKLKSYSLRTMVHLLHLMHENNLPEIYAFQNSWNQTLELGISQIP